MLYYACNSSLARKKSAASVKTFSTVRNWSNAEELTSRSSFVHTLNLALLGLKEQSLV